MLEKLKIDDFIVLDAQEEEKNLTVFFLKHFNNAKIVEVCKYYIHKITE